MSLRIATRFAILLSTFLLCAGCTKDQEKGDGDSSAGGTGSGGNDSEGTAGNGGAGGTTVVVPVDTTVPVQPWDWAGVIGSGQSLAVGQMGTPVESTEQPYNNLKLSTGTLTWPVDSSDETLELVPLVEPIGRLSTAYPSSWPTNIAGETPHSSMANQVTKLVKDANGDDYVGIHGEFGENGQCLTYLVKDAVESGVNGRAYAATLVETQAITRLAEAQGKTYGVGAMILTHGECDAGNTSYADQVYQLLTDYNTDIATITGQTQKIQLILSQQNGSGSYAASTQAAWQLGVDHPDEVVCSGPKYHLPYASDTVHLTTLGYQMLGEKYGQVYYERIVQGRDWQPLYPTSVEHEGQDLIVHFHVPVSPLAWEDTFTTPLEGSSYWSAGKGFEVRVLGKSRITISSVQIEGDTVRITCADELPETGIRVAYAMQENSAAMSAPYAGTMRWGLLKDSDPFVGSQTGMAQPNYAVAFYIDLE